VLEVRDGSGGGGDRDRDGDHKNSADWEVNSNEVKINGEGIE
jgi:hypothetical protein